MIRTLGAFSLVKLSLLIDQALGEGCEPAGFPYKARSGMWYQQVTDESFGSFDAPQSLDTRHGSSAIDGRESSAGRGEGI
jgi:hypothetical protein